jgi:hypothetical protein
LKGLGVSEVIMVFLLAGRGDLTHGPMCARADTPAAPDAGIRPVDVGVTVKEDVDFSYDLSRADVPAAPAGPADPVIQVDVLRSQMRRMTVQEAHVLLCRGSV